MQQLADDCLDVKVLDPAMGSGHFLVEAVSFVSDKLIDFLNGWSENTVWALLERTREDIRADLDRQGVTVDVARLTRVTLLKRLVLKRCIYGVDLNPMAVELAKVSLWLDAFTLGAPLSFLDHHLKCGNSLIGARVKEVQDYVAFKAGQEMLDMFSSSEFAGVMLATDLMRQVGYLPDNTVAQAKRSAEAYHDANDHLAPFKRMLDVYTSRWFGNGTTGKKNAPDTVRLFLRDERAKAWLKNPATRLDDAKMLFPATQMTQITLNAAAEKRFFHWELEFPEVFFAAATSGGQDIVLREDGGFDAVVGNPPYLSEARGNKSIFQDLRYLPVIETWYEKNVDLFNFFVHLSLYLVTQNGLVAQIIPSYWMDRGSAEVLREKLVNKFLITRIVDFGDFKVFGEAQGQHSSILVVENKKAEDKKTMVYLSITDLSVSRQIDHELIAEILREDSNHVEAQYVLSHGQLVIETMSDKMLRERFNKIPFFTLDSESIIRGVDTMPSDIKGTGVFILNNEEYLRFEPKLTTSEREIIKPFYAASKIDKFYYDSENSHWLIYTDEKARDRIALFPDDFPSLKSHLDKFQQHITSSNAPYGLHRPKSLDIFTNQQKMLFVRKTEYPKFSIIEIPYFVDYSVYIVLGGNINVSLHYLTTIFNSSLGAYWFRLHKTQGSQLQIDKGIILNFPIYRIDFTTHATERERLAQNLIDLYTPGKRSQHLLTAIKQVIESGKTDVIHDFLAHLAQQMIDFNKDKQAKVKAFLTEVESALNIKPDNKGNVGLDALNNKTSLQDFLRDYQKGELHLSWGQYLVYLRGNKTRFNVPLAEVEDQLKAAYEQAIDALLPIKRRLKDTDLLIDQIVYQLYGLTEDEIALIERPAVDQALADAKQKVKENDKLSADPDAAFEFISESIAPAVERFSLLVTSPDAQATLDATFPTWRQLPPRVQTLLKQAEHDYLDETREDYTGSQINYAKAVEVTLKERLFDSFKDAGYTEADVINEKAFKPYMTGRHKLTLGNFPFLFSSKETKFRTFLNTLYSDTETRIFGEKGLTSFLTADKINARNGAAHDEVISRDSAEQTRDWAFAILGLL